MTAGACAECGKEGDDLKRCAGCHSVNYCGRDCQLAHRPRHKTECKELLDEKLFRQPPTIARLECPICYLPSFGKGILYQSCCGKSLCKGCFFGCAHEHSDIPPCPFCRAPPCFSDEVKVGRLMQRAEANDAFSLSLLGSKYENGDWGLPQNSQKAVELWSKGAKLGSALCHGLLGHAYDSGRGVEKDSRKAIQHFQMAAIGGDNSTRRVLGCIEYQSGNRKKAMRHWIISAKVGYDDALQFVQDGYRDGLVSKEDFEATLRAHKCAKDEMKSHKYRKAEHL